jgi:hypothetical protein
MDSDTEKNIILEIESTLSPQKAQRKLMKIGKRHCCFCKEVKDLDKFINRKDTKGKNIYRRGCKLCENAKSLERYHKKKNVQTLEEAIAYKFYQAKYRSKQKNRMFNLSIGDVVNLWNIQNGKCYYTGIDMTVLPNNYNHFSLDRKDSSQGYEPENIVLCTHVVNLMKKDMTHDLFVEYCAMVVSHCHTTCK